MNTPEYIKRDLEHHRKELERHDAAIKDLEKDLAALTITPADITPGAVFSQSRGQYGTTYKTVIQEEGSVYSLLGIDFDPFRNGGAGYANVIAYRRTKEALAQRLTREGYVKAGKWELKK